MYIYKTMAKQNLNEWLQARECILLCHILPLAIDTGIAIDPWACQLHLQGLRSYPSYPDIFLPRLQGASRYKFFRPCRVPCISSETKKRIPLSPALYKALAILFILNLVYLYNLYNTDFLEIFA